MEHELYEILSQIAVDIRAIREMTEVEFVKNNPEEVKKAK